LPALLLAFYYPGDYMQKADQRILRSILDECVKVEQQTALLY
jgi:hypothetical protein